MVQLEKSIKPRKRKGCNNGYYSKNIFAIFIWSKETCVLQTYVSMFGVTRSLLFNHAYLVYLVGFWGKHTYLLVQFYYFVEHMLYRKQNSYFTKSAVLFPGIFQAGFI